MQSAPERPSEASPTKLTQLLNRMQHGDYGAGDQAVGLVYDELRRIASSRMRRERPGRTLQTTGLVHEAYLRLMGGSPITIQNRGHFFALASTQMRRLLVEAARRANVAGERVDLDHVRLGTGERHIDLLLLDESLQELERIDQRSARVIELRYFGGYTDEQVAETLGISSITVRRDWAYARSWLFKRMRSNNPLSPASKQPKAGE
jgi:RNA polymerase sigma-70 factor (ECF subfamily)